MMKLLVYFSLTCAAVTLVGCGDNDNSAAAPAASTPPPVQTAANTVPTPAPMAAPTAPPNSLVATGPAASAPDPLDNLKNAPDGSKKSDLEALQAIVDGYAFGVDGLGAPPIASLDVLVAKGFLKRIPAPPAGKKWAYDSNKWKVSLVDQ